MFKSDQIPYLFLILIPIVIAYKFFPHADSTVLLIAIPIIFIPLVRLIGKSTEHISFHYGMTTASLVKVSFGNIAEVIIAILAISDGLINLVKASIIGSILANVLFVFGFSLFAGGLKTKEQFINKENIGFQSSMLFIATVGLAMPTILFNTLLKPINIENQTKITLLSDVLAFVLLGIYLASIIFTFFTHKEVFESKTEGIEENLKNDRRDKNINSLWTKKKSFLILGLGIIGIIIVGHILVDSIRSISGGFALEEFFGGIVIGLINSVPKNIVAISDALKGRLEAAVNIAAGGGTQIIFFVVPTLIMAGIVLGKPFALIFTVFELVSVFFASIIFNLVVRDGKSNWFEGVMLLGVYVIIAAGYYVI